MVTITAPVSTSSDTSRTMPKSATVTMGNSGSSTAATMSYAEVLVAQPISPNLLGVHPRHALHLSQEVAHPLRVQSGPACPARHPTRLGSRGDFHLGGAEDLTDDLVELVAHGA